MYVYFSLIRNLNSLIGKICPIIILWITCVFATTTTERGIRFAVAVSTAGRGCWFHLARPVNRNEKQHTFTISSRTNCYRKFGATFIYRD